MQFSFTSLTNFDIANICLQRTNILFNYKQGKEAFAQWQNNKFGFLLSFIEDNPKIAQEIVESWATHLYKEYHEEKTNLADKIDDICDIGCGYALFDLFAFNDFNSKLTLLDIELSTSKNHLFHRDVFSGYSSNISTYNLLIENNVHKNNINLINPVINDLPKNKSFNLIISLYSLGFHYPLLTYEKFILDTLKIGGDFIFDDRIGFNDCKSFFKRFKNVYFKENGKKRRVYCKSFLGDL